MHWDRVRCCCDIYSSHVELCNQILEHACFHPTESSTKRSDRETQERHRRGNNNNENLYHTKNTHLRRQRNQTRWYEATNNQFKRKTDNFTKSKRELRVEYSEHTRDAQIRIITWYKMCIRPLGSHIARAINLAAKFAADNRMTATHKCVIKLTHWHTAKSE